MQKIGILGGGQLGRMLLQAAANYPVETYVLENDSQCPAAHLCHHFVKGSITDFDTVYQFGKGLDAITIEIENVNIGALERLEAEGVRVYPKPSVLKTIKNKIIQKEFYKTHSIPSSDFVITQNAHELSAYESFLPAVHKLGEGGYDGRGVEILRSKEDFAKAFDQPSVLEKLVPVKKEIAQIIAINEKGYTALYPPVEMLFNPQLNQLDFQLCPADIPEKVLYKIEAISLSVVRNLNSPGIFAVELFVDHNDEVFVNETAPRVHNSGHHTIEAHYSSQFDMLWRVLLQMPLGNPEAILSSVMINIIGEPDFSGPVFYEGFSEVLKIENAFFHLYGKKETKPGRKMGHATVMSADKQELLYQANKIRNTLKVKSK